MTTKQWLVVVTAIGSAMGVARADPLDNWHRRGTNALLANDDLRAVTWGNERFVAVGSSAGRTLAFLSTNGIDWRGRLADGGGMLGCVAWGSNGFVAASPKTDLSQAATIQNGGLDGENWFERGSYPSDSLYAVTYGNGRYVVAGFDWAALNGVIVVSTNGFDWVRHSFSESGISDSGILNGVTFANDTFVAVSFSPGNAYTSIDGITWTNRGTVPGMPRAILSANGMFLVAGGPEIFNGAANVVTSFDLQSWTWHSAGGANYNSAIAHGAGTFVVVGNSPGTLSYSRNTIDWTELRLGDFSLSAVAYGKGAFVVVGGDRIFQSDIQPTARLTAGGMGRGGFALSIRGETGFDYRLQATADVAGTNWLDLLHFTSATNITDTAATNFRHRFYRVISP